MTINKLIFYWLLCCFFAVISLVLLGGFTRLTDSGLSITEWELFEGILPPFTESSWNSYFNAYKTTPEFNKINYSINLADFKFIFYMEYFHRLLARLLGLLTLIPLLYFYFRKLICLKDFLRYIIIFVLVLVQGVLGWYMVKSGLIDRPDVSHFRLASHLFMASIILSYILWQALNCGYIKFKNSGIANPLYIIILLYIQIILGALVAGLDAGMIYNEFPLMGGKFIADDSFITGAYYKNLFYNPSFVQLIHRMNGYLIFVAVLFYLYQNYKIRKNVKNWLAIFLFFLIVMLQLLVGVLALIYQVPLWIGVVHQSLAFLLLSYSLYIFILYRAKEAMK